VSSLLLLWQLLLVILIIFIILILIVSFSGLSGFLGLLSVSLLGFTLLRLSGVESGLLGILVRGNLGLSGLSLLD